jgi:hypothetical protein
MAREFKNFKPKGKSKEEIEDVVKNYQGKSESELMGEIINKYSEGIQNGSLSREELDRFASNASQYLTPEQQKKLSSIVNKLKSY